MIGVAANAVLTLIDAARQSPLLWRQIPFLLGSTPNLVAVPAIAFTVFGVVTRPDVGVSAWARKRPATGPAIVLLTVLGLLVWEVLQRWSTRLRFDWWDVAATVVGGVVCAGVLRIGWLRRDS